MKFKIHSGLYIVLANCLFFASMAFLLPIRFETNDDIGMLLIASGKYTGIPDAHLVYINYIYGSVISFLYKLYANIEWYTLAFVIVHIISLSIISNFLLKKLIPTVYKILFIFILYIVEIRFIQNFQFTTTAALCALAGLISLEGKTYKWLVASILLLITATMIRFESAFLVIIVYAPFLLKESIYAKRLIITKKHIFFALAIVFSVFFRYIDSLSYNSTPQLKYYKECNKYFDETVDNPNAYSIIYNLPKEIIYDDYHVMMKFFIDASVFTKPVLKEINDKVNNRSFYEKARYIVPSLRMYSHYLFYLFLFSVVLGICAKSWKNRFLLIIYFSVFISILSFIALDGQIKNRVFMSAVLPLLILFFDSIDLSFIKRLGAISIGCIIILFSIEECKEMYSIKENRNRENSLFLEQQNLVKTYFKNSNNYILPFYDNFAIENSNPFNVSKSMNYRRFVFSGWLALSPYSMKMFPSFSKLSENIAILISKKQFENTIKIQNSILTHFKVKTQVTKTIQSDHFLIVTFKNKEN